MEGKDKPTKGPYAEYKFEYDLGCKIAELTVIMTESLWGYGRSVIIDSDFGYVPPVAQLKNMGLFATTVIKKKAIWPNKTEAKEAIDEMQG